jgi:hypothetical protein
VPEGGGVAHNRLQQEKNQGDKQNPEYRKSVFRVLPFCHQRAQLFQKPPQRAGMVQSMEQIDTLSDRHPAIAMSG